MEICGGGLVISKQVLVQYNDLKEEIVEVQKKIDDLEKYIQKIEEEGNVVDTVTGGSGGIQHYRIEGFPYPEYSKKKTLLLTRKSILIQLESELEEQINEVEHFITSVTDSQMRRIIRMKVLENKTWVQIGRIMNVTPDSCRVAFDRFMKEN